jgi:exosortase/archaeosortase family protein
MARKTPRPAAAEQAAFPRPLAAPTSEAAGTPETPPETALGRLRAALGRNKYRTEIRFVVTFAAIAGVLFSVYSFPYPDGSAARHWSDAYLRAYAHMAGGILSIFEGHLAVDGQNIVGSYSLRIIRGCDAIDAQILLLSAVLASPSHSWRWRIYGALAGFLLITVANVARVCCLYYVGAHFPAQFDFFHHELWPLLLIVLAAVAFIVWSRLGGSRERGAHVEA